MADYNSSLPVRTQNNGDVAATLVDFTVPTQGLAIDAAGALALTATGPASPGTASAFSLLTGGIYNSTLPTLTNGQQASLQLDASGLLMTAISAALPTGSNTIGAVTQASGPWTMNLTQVGGSAVALGQALMAASIPVVIASDQSPVDVSAAQSGTWTVQPGNTANTTPWLVTVATALPAGTNNIGKIEITDGTNTAAVAAASTAAAASDPALVVALSPNSPLPAGSNAIGSVLANLQVSNTAVSASNPVPVSVTSSVAGTAVQDYHTSASLAANASVTFTYTVPALNTFNLQRVWASSSGKIKVVVNNNGSPIFVGFNSTATPNVDMTVISPPAIAAGNTVTVVITNRENQPEDVYATIEGNRF